MTITVNAAAVEFLAQASAPEARIVSAPAEYAALFSISEARIHAAMVEIMLKAQTYNYVMVALPVEYLVAIDIIAHSPAFGTMVRTRKCHCIRLKP